MKTLEQILEGVTAVGQWEVQDLHGISDGDMTLLTDDGEFKSSKDAAYAARAARIFPGLVGALQACFLALSSYQMSNASPNLAESAANRAAKTLAEALKD